MHPAKYGRIFLCALQIDKYSTKIYSGSNEQRVRNTERGGGENGGQT